MMKYFLPHLDDFLLEFFHVSCWNLFKPLHGFKKLLLNIRSYILELPDFA